MLNTLRVILKCCWLSFSLTHEWHFSRETISTSVNMFLKAQAVVADVSKLSCKISTLSWLSFIFRSIFFNVGCSASKHLRIEFYVAATQISSKYQLLKSEKKTFLILDLP